MALAYRMRIANGSSIPSIRGELRPPAPSRAAGWGSPLQWNTFWPTVAGLRSCPAAVPGSRSGFRYNEAMTFPRWLLLSAACAFVAACSGLDSRNPYWIKPGAMQSPSAIESLIAYRAYVHDMNGAEWARENVRLRDGGNGDVAACARRAVLASAPAAPIAERQRAQELYDRCEKGAAAAGRDFAAVLALLRSTAADRARAEERIREEARRSDELARVLKELRAIDKTLLDRNQSSGKSERK